MTDCFLFLAINFLPSARYEFMPAILFISEYELLPLLPLIFSFREMDGHI